MPYDYLDDQVTADITFRAWGRDLEELFRAAADATVNAMVEEVGSIRRAVVKHVTIEAEELDMLLLRFLDELIFYKDAHSLILRATAVRVEAAASHYHLDGELAGETIDPMRHDLVGDVKAVTLAGLCVQRTEAGWRAQVTLDV